MVNEYINVDFFVLIEEILDIYFNVIVINRLILFFFVMVEETLDIYFNKIAIKYIKIVFFILVNI